MVSFVHGVAALIHMELLPLFTPTRKHRLWVKGVRSLGRPVSSLDHCRPARWAVNNADVNGCHVQSSWTSATRVENTPGHRPPVWRTHQDTPQGSPNSSLLYLKITFSEQPLGVCSGTSLKLIAAPLTYNGRGGRIRKNRWYHFGWVQGNRSHIGGYGQDRL